MHVVYQASEPAVLLRQLQTARDESDRLFQVVRPEFLYQRPIAERHRIIFYVGHLEAFDWNLLGQRAFGMKAFAANFDQLFAFGIDPVGGGLPTDTEADWPDRETVTRYVGRVRKELDEGITRRGQSSEDQQFPLEQLLHVAIEHRWMHAETLAYMLHRMPVEQKLRPHADPTMLAAAADHRMRVVPAGDVKLGLRRDANEFGWDNEFEEHTVAVPPFAIDRYKVTNGQFLKFVLAGGYKERSFWTQAGWDWIQSSGTEYPAFWRHDGGRWLQRTMFDEVLLPLDWPVFVSHAEASAYANWRGNALPTEAQWQRAAYGDPQGAQRRYPWGTGTVEGRRGNFDFRRWDPSPVQSYQESASAWGVEGMLGNGWEWTSTLFAPFPGFEAFPFYQGYSANFFDQRHYVMKGGSMRTAGCLLRPSFRNWFQPHYPYVYAGFRCVAN
jgi:ergothioneine biosynthesis protein EgtB